MWPDPLVPSHVPPRPPRDPLHLLAEGRAPGEDDLGPHLSARDARLCTFLGAVDVALLRHVVHACFLPPGPATRAALRRASTLAARRLTKLVARGILRAFVGPLGHRAYALAAAGEACATEPTPRLGPAAQARRAALLGPSHALLVRDSVAYLHRALPGPLAVLGLRACYPANPERVGRKIPDGALRWWPPGDARPLTLWLEAAYRPLRPVDLPRWRARTERFCAEHPADRILYVLAQGRPAHILELAGPSRAAGQLLAVRAGDLLRLAPVPPASASDGRGGVVIRPLLDALQGGGATLADGPDVVPAPDHAAALRRAVAEDLGRGLSLVEAVRHALATWPDPLTLPDAADILEAEFGIAIALAPPPAQPPRSVLF